METKQVANQVWAHTNPNNNVQDMRWQDGYYGFQDGGSLDAPDFVAAGATVENVVAWSNRPSERCIIGAIVRRG